MRWSSLALLVVLFAPVASAGTPAIVTLVEGGYAVTMTDASGDLRSQRIPFDAGGYDLDGVQMSLAAPPRTDAKTRIVFLGDMGTENATKAVVDAIIAEKPDLVLLGGDLAYAHGDPLVWRRWSEILSPLSATVPTMPAFGNHEDFCQGNGTSLLLCGPNGNQWHARFPLPNGEKLYYRFDWGPVRITVLDTEAYGGNAKHPTTVAEQGRFLSESLAGDTTRWDIVMFHRPLRTTNTHNAEPPGGERASLEGQLEQGADLVLQSHVHAYERAKPTENGVVYVTSGGGGRQLYDKWAPMEPWVATRAAAHHFVVFDINATRIDARAVRPDGTTLDSFSLERAAIVPPPTPSPTGSPTRPSVSPTASPTPNMTSGVPIETGSKLMPQPWILALVGLTLSARLLVRRVRG